MATTDDTIDNRRTGGIGPTVRAGGAWLALGALAFFVGILLHPPPPSDPNAFMATIAADPTRWMAAHWVSAVAVFLLSGAGLVVLASRSRLTDRPATASAWAGLVVAGLWIATAAIVEATVITRAAVAGDTATFAAWQPFAEAHAAAVVVVGLAAATIAWNEARAADPATPRVASWVGAAAGVLSATGFVLGVGLGVALGGPLWLVSTLALSLWTFWFGLALARVDGRSATSTRQSEPTG